MKNHFRYTFFLLFLTVCSFGQTSVEKTYKGKSVEVYTTAKDTNLRISKTVTKKFGDSKQPLETEISVFVNPSKTFQSFMGIGGAISDASAEVFARLPKENQKKLLKTMESIKSSFGN